MAGVELFQSTLQPFWGPLSMQLSQLLIVENYWLQAVLIALLEGSSSM